MFPIARRIRREYQQAVGSVEGLVYYSGRRKDDAARNAKQMAIYVQPSLRPSSRDTQVNARTYDAALRDKLQMEVEAASGLFYKLLQRFDGGRGVADTHFRCWISKKPEVYNSNQDL